MNYVNFLNAELNHISYIGDPWSYTPSTCHEFGVKGFLEVFSKDCNKTVEIYYTYDGINWKTKYANYLQTTPYGNEIWNFNLDTEKINQNVIKENFKCAIRLNSFSKDYWANNYGKNYNLHIQNLSNSPAPFFKFEKADIYKTSANQHIFNEHCRKKYLLKVSCSIEIDPDDHHKTVELYYKIDNNWKTHYASYTSTLENGKELWTFNFEHSEINENTDLGLIKQFFQYAFKLKYFQNIYWHNNYGNNYN